MCINIQRTPESWNMNLGRFKGMRIMMFQLSGFCCVLFVYVYISIYIYTHTHTHLCMPAPETQRLTWTPRPSFAFDEEDGTLNPKPQNL